MSTMKTVRRFSLFHGSVWGSTRFLRCWIVMWLCAGNLELGRCELQLDFLSVTHETSSRSSCAGDWQSCTGTCCSASFSCIEINPHYSQCQPTPCTASADNEDCTATQECCSDDHSCLEVSGGAFQCLPCTSSLQDCTATQACCSEGDLCVAETTSKFWCREACPDPSWNWECSKGEALPTPEPCTDATDDYGNCATTQACCNPDFTCYKQNADISQCLPTTLGCPTNQGWECETCELQEGDNCFNVTGCCEPFLGCFQREFGHAECAGACPEGSGWDCAVCGLELYDECTDMLAEGSCCMEGACFQKDSGYRECRLACPIAGPGEVQWDCESKEVDLLGDCSGGKTCKLGECLRFSDAHSYCRLECPAGWDCACTLNAGEACDAEGAAGCCDPAKGLGCQQSGVGEFVCAACERVAEFGECSDAAAQCCEPGLGCFNANATYAECRQACPDGWACSECGLPLNAECTEASGEEESAGCCQRGACLAESEHQSFCKLSCPEGWRCDRCTIPLYGDCSDPTACCDAAAGLGCFAFNDTYKECRHECPLAAEPVWSCECGLEDGESCAAGAGCCKEGLGCYQLDADQWQCKPDCPDEWWCACTLAEGDNCTEVGAGCCSLGQNLSCVKRDSGEFECRAECGGGWDCDRCERRLHDRCFGEDAGAWGCCSEGTCFKKDRWHSQCEIECPRGQGWACEHCKIPEFGECTNPEAGCCMEGTDCFRQDAFFSQCLQTCPLGQGWDCEECTIPMWGNCHELPRGCCANGATCYQKDAWYSQCLDACPAGWECDTQGIIQELGECAPGEDRCRHGTECFAKDDSYAQCLQECPLGVGWQCECAIPEGGTCSDPAAGCCANATSCFQKNATFSQCLAECPEDEDWDCDCKIPKWGDCTHPWNGCCEVGLECFSKSQWYAQCLEECPGPGWACYIEPLSPVECPGGLIDAGERCWQYVGEAGSWEEANTRCAGRGLALASLHSDRDRATAYEVLRASNHSAASSAWVGGRGGLAQMWGWEWSDGATFSYSPWFTFRPEGPALSCLSLQLTARTVAGSDSIPCAASLPSLCASAARPCPAGSYGPDASQCWPCPGNGSSVPGENLGVLSCLCPEATALSHDPRLPSDQPRSCLPLLPKYAPIFSDSLPPSPASATSPAPTTSSVSTSAPPASSDAAVETSSPSPSSSAVTLPATSSSSVSAPTTFSGAATTSPAPTTSSVSTSAPPASSDAAVETSSSSSISSSSVSAPTTSFVAATTSPATTSTTAPPTTTPEPTTPPECTGGVYNTEDGRCWKWTSGGLTWEEAEAECAASGMHLASVSNSKGRALLESMYVDHGLYAGELAWLGGRLAASGGPNDLPALWEWVDGAPQHFVPWDLDWGEPSSRMGYPQECMAVRIRRFLGEAALYAVDQFCSERAFGVCASTPAPCPAGTYGAALPDCEPCPSGGSSEPGRNSDVLSCQCPEGYAMAVWGAEELSCVSSSCSGGVEDQRSLRCLRLLSHASFDFDGAAAACEAEGLQLATLAGEDTIVAGRMLRAAGRGGGDLAGHAAWIGARRPAAGEPLEWLSGLAFHEWNFPWGIWPQEPSGDKSQQCLAYRWDLTSASSAGLDLHCEERLPALCAGPLEPCPAGQFGPSKGWCDECPDGGASRAGSNFGVFACECPPGKALVLDGPSQVGLCVEQTECSGGLWDAGTGRCWKLVEAPGTWEELSGVCRGLGLAGASLHAWTHRRAVSEIFAARGLPRQGYLWVGASDAEEEGGWGWSDGSVMAGRSWDFGEPDGGEAQNCGAVRAHGRLADVECGRAEAGALLAGALCATPPRRSWAWCGEHECQGQSSCPDGFFGNGFDCQPCPAGANSSAGDNRGPLACRCPAGSALVHNVWAEGELQAACVNASCDGVLDAATGTCWALLPNEPRGDWERKQFYCEQWGGALADASAAPDASLLELLVSSQGFNLSQPHLVWVGAHADLAAPSSPDRPLEPCPAVSLDGSGMSLRSDVGCNATEAVQLFACAAPVDAAEVPASEPVEVLLSDCAGCQFVSVGAGQVLGRAGVCSLECSHLDLASRGVQGVAAAAFDAMPGVRFLDLSRNALTALNSSRLSGLARLAALDLAENRVSAVADGALAGLDQLTSLSLRGNAITHLQPGLFDRAQGLHALFLAGNPLGCQPVLRTTVQLVDASWDALPACLPRGCAGDAPSFGLHFADERPQLHAAILSTQLAMAMLRPDAFRALDAANVAGGLYVPGGSPLQRCWCTATLECFDAVPGTLARGAGGLSSQPGSTDGFSTAPPPPPPPPALGEEPPVLLASEDGEGRDGLSWKFALGLAMLVGSGLLVVIAAASLAASRRRGLVDAPVLLGGKLKLKAQLGFVFERRLPGKSRSWTGRMDARESFSMEDVLSEHDILSSIHNENFPSDKNKSAPSLKVHCSAEGYASL